MENSIEVPQKKKKKLEIRLTYDPAIPILAIYPYKTEFKKIHPNVQSSIIYNSQDMETGNLNVHQQMNKDVVHTHTHTHTHTHRNIIQP